MKPCAHCREPLADVAARCPACGMAVGAQPGSYRPPHDEALGFSHEDWLLKTILLLLGLLICVGLWWFLQ
jgi:hypothetical protein